MVEKTPRYLTTLTSVIFSPLTPPTSSPLANADKPKPTSSRQRRCGRSAKESHSSSSSALPAKGFECIVEDNLDRGGMVKEGVLRGCIVKELIV